VSSDERLERDSDLVADFFGGVAAIQKLAAWAYFVAHEQELRRAISLFADAMEELAKLDAAGRLGVAEGADFSRENVQRARRLDELVRSGLDKEDLRKVAQELHDLAHQCTRSFLSTG
jgi:hypothetical protein